MTALYFLLTAIILGIGAILYRLRSQGGDSAVNVKEWATLKADLEKKTEKIGELQSEVQEERAAKNELSGENKELSTQHESLKSDHKNLGSERDRLKEEVSSYKEQQVRLKQEAETERKELNNATQSLKEERQRVIKEDEEKLKKEAEERDRMWAEHENSVIALLSDLCKQPQFAFRCYNNNNLPEGFDGKLKPDFLIEFLGQYIIFDAKVSKSNSLQTYINDSVKKTVEKVKRDPKIFPTIFLVVPTQAISELKKTWFLLDGFNVYVISPESLAPILASLKRITAYELAEQLDPQERENIINVIAEFDYHINLRNAADLFLSKMGTSILGKSQMLTPDIRNEVATKKAEMKMPSFAVAELKRMASSTATQEEEIRQLISPKSAIKKDALDAANDLMSGGLT